MSALVISLDFELFWGMAESKSIKSYGANVDGECVAVPAILGLFKQYGVHATWATVGMLMCKDYKQWCDLRPPVMPTYKRKMCSTYSAATLARDFPKLFFARQLVDQILDTDGQELASHTYSHFFCSEAGVTAEQFSADLICNQIIFDEVGVKPTSFVFPRNQTVNEYLDILSVAGFTAYRGNADHWMYRDGNFVPCGNAGRLTRLLDAYIALTGNHVSPLTHSAFTGGLVNIPASRLLRPLMGNIVIDMMHLNRVKNGMLEAAKSDGVFHLWWHPHNFGLNTEENLINLENILKYYRFLHQEYGMRSCSMKEVDVLCRRI